MRTAVDVIEWRGERARVGRWRGDVRTAHLVPVPGAPAPSNGFLARCVDELVARGYQAVVTGALAPPEQGAFLQNGFEVQERLHLLAHDLRDLPAALAPEATLRRTRRSERPAVLEVDSLAFGPFWRLDDESLEEALTATPVARFRVADGGAGNVVGYAISGRAGRRGYVQRLAVHPERQRTGLGRALVLDGLRWMRRWSVDSAVVNTQLENEAALSLYLGLGFRLQRDGLAVLARALS